MPTESELERAEQVFDELFENFDDPRPLEGADLRQFQRRCLVEAKRLLRLLATPRLRKTIRNDIENMALFWSVLSQKKIIEQGDCRLLASVIGRNLKEFQHGKLHVKFPYQQDLEKLV